MVVGDNSILKIKFERPATSASFRYYVSIDYTADDLRAEGYDITDEQRKNLKAENFDAAFNLKLFKDNQMVLDANASGVTSPDNVDLGKFVFDSMEITTSRVGTIHFDSIRWTPS